MGRTCLTRVPQGENCCTLLITLAKEKINISVILPLIKYEVLRESECLNAVSLLTEDISMHNSVHIHCYANKCASNSFPLMVFFRTSAKPSNPWGFIQRWCIVWETINFSSCKIHTKAKWREESKSLACFEGKILCATRKYKFFCSFKFLQLPNSSSTKFQYFKNAVT